MKFISLVVVGVTSLSVAACTFDRPPALVDGPPPDAEVPPDSRVEPAVLTSEHASHDFTDITVGAQSIEFDVVVRNSGPTASGALQATLSGEAGEFEIVAGGCQSVVLGPDETCTAQVVFRPISAGTHAAVLEVSAVPGGTVTVELLGNGLTPGSLEITVGGVIDFATTELESQSGVERVTVRNNGGTATAALSVTLPDQDNFLKVLGGDTCNGVPLGAGSTCTVEVRFTPITVDQLSTQLSIRESETVGVPATLNGVGSARLRVTKNGTGTGTITSTEAGISCAAACSSAEVSFIESPITLTASVVSGYAFEGWGGACAGAGTNAECTVSLTVALTEVTASFRAWECAPDSITCDDNVDRYVDCSSTGTIDFEMVCSLGCVDGVEKCLDVLPSNGVAEQLDLAATHPSARDVVLAGSAVMNTDTGAVLADGEDQMVPHAMVGNLRVFMFRSLSVSGTLKVTGNLPAVIVSDGVVLITGTVDVSADSSTRGPGGQATGVCAGGTAASASGGGGGGGKSGIGRRGGTGGTVSGGAGGVAIPDADLDPLTAGCKGGEVNGGVLRHAYGGGGGGAIQIVSRRSISLTGSGVIDASGGGATACFVETVVATCAGAGGGSGGAILLEAPEVTLNGSGVVLSTKGGSGAADGNTGVATAAGRDGGTTATAAAGGTNGALAAGGAGGGFGSNAGLGSGSATANGGGGGGGIGEARINTVAGSFSPANGAVVRSSQSSGFLGTRQVP